MPWKAVPEQMRKVREGLACISRSPAVAVALSIALCLSACSAEPAAPRDTPMPAASDNPGPRDPATTPADRPEPSPPVSAPPAHAPDVDRTPQHEPRLDGFGPLRLGMTAQQAQDAWPGVLSRIDNASQRQDCFHVTVEGLPYFTLMFESGRFVRYDAGDESIAAPGGGRRGMIAVALQALYGNALASKPDRFARGGTLLSMQASGVAPSKLVFVLRPDGVVNEWRVGSLPQADYDEGCESAG